MVLVITTALSIQNSNTIGETKKTATKNGKIQIGKASYYGKRFHGEKTASGRTFNRNHLVAAHPSYPYGTRVRVTNLENSRQVEVRIIDRGPTKAQRKKGTIIDLSRAAAEKLGMVRRGRAKVRLEVVEWGKFKKIAEEDHKDESIT
ncbi:MAG: septal ring lytic transglycosylase RlpA family lipoprotein [Desulfobacca sp.]|nr:septal ring lytic transglycosylase RlpA family lipoprotein [Desulfobacca sp.]